MSILTSFYKKIDHGKIVVLRLKGCSFTRAAYMIEYFVYEQPIDIGRVTKYYKDKDRDILHWASKTMKDPQRYPGRPTIEPVIACETTAQYRWLAKIFAPISLLLTVDYRVIAEVEHPYGLEWEADIASIVCLLSPIIKVSDKMPRDWMGKYYNKCKTLASLAREGNAVVIEKKVKQLERDWGPEWKQYFKIYEDGDNYE